MCNTDWVQTVQTPKVLASRSECIYRFIVLDRLPWNAAQRIHDHWILSASDCSCLCACVCAMLCFTFAAEYENQSKWGQNERFSSNTLTYENTHMWHVCECTISILSFFSSFLRACVWLSARGKSKENFTQEILFVCVCVRVWCVSRIPCSSWAG